MASYCEAIVFLVLLSQVNGSLYDESSGLDHITVSRTSTLTVSSDVHKHGGRSLKWTWQPGDIFRLDLYHEPVEAQQLQRGGIKVWLYLLRNIPGKITVSFYTSFLMNSGRARDPECQFDISLNFNGWRGVWVTFKECRLRERIFPLYRMQLRAPDAHSGEIYIDLLRIVRTVIRKQTRDEIVPPIRGRASKRKNFWQQTYRWSLVKPKDNIFNDIQMSDEEMHKLRDIRLVRTRLRDWYCDGTKATYELTGYSRHRWLQLRRNIKRAHEGYKMLNISRTKGFLRGPPLFSRNSEYGKLKSGSPELKFGFVMRDVLLPLALEYFFQTRKQETHRIVEEELPKLNNPKLATQTVQRLVGHDKELTKVFFKSSKLQVRPLKESKLRFALREINRHRFLRIIRLLEYILDQGWAVGSALGSLDHEMNRSSKGFVISVFLLRQPLQRAGKLSQLINIMKWYLEFGELYQHQFEYDGTTADRMRTLMLYRLMCILVMPEATFQQAFDKLRDMEALKKWYENALRVNPALGGVIKPDYTGYHHLSFYPNDYVLPALHAASHVVYLLRGTTFELNETSQSNLRKAIDFMRILSVKYSIPNSVTNTDPTFAKPELICLIPAFAYVTLFVDRPRDGFHVSREMPTQAIASLRSFLRMFNESDPDVQRYLSRGKGCQWKMMYMDTLGSLSLLYRLKRRAKQLGITAEQSPVGNWAKNFAALAIHRRDDWAVTIKGFNNFVWGYESSRRGNHYGLYQSHGQLIIANSDQAVRANNIRQGWDWTRLPGTTTLRVPFEHLVYKKSRFYNQRNLSGAVSFQGTSRLRNGVFIMDYQRPDYGPSRGEWDQETLFSFRKSVFFYNELLVCLGSDIRAERLTPVDVETTLFQNTRVFNGQTHGSVHMNGFDLPVEPTVDAKRFTWRNTSPAILMDVNGNGYYVPYAGKQNLNVRLGNQSSYDSKLVDVTTEGYFATAWLKHGANPRGMTYEYAILVSTAFKKLHDFACRQEKMHASRTYEVLRQDQHAHVVKFNNAPRQGLTTYGYSVFRKNVLLPGPLWIVGDPCVVMVEDGGIKSKSLVLGLSYPQLNFNMTKKLRTSYDVKEEEQFYMRSQEKRVWIFLKYKVNVRGYLVYVNRKRVDPEKVSEYARVIPTHPGASAGSLLYFLNLFNGFTTEVHFHRFQNPDVEA